MIGYWAPASPNILPGAESNTLYGVHASVLYDGEHERLLLFRNRGLVYDLETPDQYWELDLVGSGDPVPTPNLHEPFCSGYVPLGDGRLFIVGTSYWKYHSFPSPLIPMRDGKASLFDPSADMTDIEDYWEVAQELPEGTGQPLGGLGPGAPDCTDCAGEPHPWSLARYYPTLVRLEDGRVLVAAGDFWIDCQIPTPPNPCGCACQGPLEVDQQNKWAIWDRSEALGNQWTWDNNSATGLGGTFSNPWVAHSESTLNPFMVSYPRIKMLPIGLFYAGNDAATDSNAQNSYLWTPLSEWYSPGADYLESSKIRNRLTGGCVVLTLDALSTDISILMVGGGADGELHAGSGPKGETGAEIITYSQDAAGVVTVHEAWKRAGTMNSGKARGDANTVLLPDGSVLAVGGEEGPEPEDQNRDCEIFVHDPEHQFEGTWVSVAGLGADRGHHSIAVLLPDGRVLSTGHENNTSGGAEFGFDYQIYYPPYLFANGNTFAARDTILTWPNPEDSDPETPEHVAYGLPFELTVKDNLAADIDEVAIMAPCSPTHGTDFSQSRVRLSHTVVPGDPGRLVVSAPKDSSYAPEGYYMLFVLADGVPSEGKWIKVKRQESSDYEITQGKKIWGGPVWLDRDFEVAEGCTLQVLAGTTVHVRANTDRVNRGVSTGKVEIIYRGTTLMPGTVSQPITFTTYDGTGAAGEWYGNRFILEGCEMSGYGTLGALNPISTIENTTIESAEYGVKIEDFVAPSLKNVQFDAITNNRHIYLDKTDVFLAPGYFPSGQCNFTTCPPNPPGCPFVWLPATWSLAPNTNVVASNTCTQDAWYGDAGKVDLIAQVRLDAVGTEADSIFFRPETPTLETGDGWGGAILDEGAYGSLWKFVSIGQAANPLFVFYADSTLTIRRSRVHHYGDTGMWFDETGPKGAVVDSCVIERGEGLDDEIGFTAVRLDQTDEFFFDRNKLDLSGLDVVGISPAVEVNWGKTFCDYPASGFDNLVIRNNHFLGPGLAASGNRSGAKFSYLCGGTTRYITIDGNYLEEFKENGFEFHQSSQAQVTCNTILEVGRGVDFFRSSDVTGQSVKFKQNWFEVKSGSQQVVRTDDNVKTAFGPAGTSLGDNGLLALNTDVKFIKELDPTVGDKLNIKDCFWYLYDATSDEEVWINDPLDGQEIVNRFDPATDVLYSPFRESGPLAFCRPSGPPGTGGSETLPVRLPSPGLVGDTSALGEVSESAPAVPRESYLTIMAQPVRGLTEIKFGVAHGDAGNISLSVYDVTGRRVLDLASEVVGAGHFRTSWNARNSEGEFASPGVYFMRMTTAGRTVVTKFLVMR